jgi:hypothetical protein
VEKKAKKESKQSSGCYLLHADDGGDMFHAENEGVMFLGNVG